MIRHPDAVAVTDTDRSITYRELDEQANQLAHSLSESGVRPGDRVALLAPRSVPAVTAMLAALKIGAAYLAVDPALPDSRIEFLLTDAAPSAVITSADLRPGSPGSVAQCSTSLPPACAPTPRSTAPAPTRSPT